MLEKGFLKALETGGGLAQPFDGEDFGVLELADRSKTGADGFAIDKNRAGAAVARVNRL